MVNGGSLRTGDQPDVTRALSCGSQKNQGAWTVTPISSKIVLDDFHGGVAQTVRQGAEVQRFLKVDPPDLYSG